MPLRKTPANDQPARPVDDAGKELISIRSLLEWAFAVEHAQLEYDDLRDTGIVREYAARSQTANVCDMLAIGKDGARGIGVRVDATPGRSYPHEDADLVAAMVKIALPWRLATMVAELARAGRTPDWGQDMRPRVEPREWRNTRHGAYAKTEKMGVVQYVSRGRVRAAPLMACPIVYRDTAQEIARVRRGYLEWWSALLSVRCALANNEMRRFALTETMPCQRPWQNADQA
ncbi:hypothetical protein [Roseovarius sp. THAF27]|uniref:hypothetical protein n=1 Tax=Roseovarius sp. THAF27 TaxID=2587850 RepID=UPI001C12C0E7|nr:hypothetical protein [Roseovarius sp. THAF27]